ncbi:TPA: hypothetical protein ACKR0U_003445 [Proteus mirabilis]|uniref:hypothetical protein n=1 Tax=Proteus mirabilis TaxID=584 RepID=UPI0013DF4802|nr:hypothetical protein [Proteus mirabilis]EKW7428947.1 hypothetical protein [Proteus mirabilis]ELA7776374.1 hypothetical protein [Proteus mirabilis]MCL8579285.1 hypothetical protein [Proteus mirabilis]MCL8589900.1 hypothetical protein [Proteus mirabilis]MCL8604033.1 hypothetical protein [Proteus mirabilis]
MEPVDTMQTIFEVISFIASIASLILAIGAIWLSIVFFKMSEQASKETSKSADKIQSSVDKLEKLFDKLYSDTFSMMKDTVGDMRQHIYHKQDSNETFGNELSKIKETLAKELKETIENKLKGSINNDKKINELEKELNKLIENKFNKAIVNDERRSTELEEKIYRFIKINKNISVSTIYIYFKNKLSKKESDKFYQILFSLRSQGKITWDGNENEIASTDIIKLTK